MTAMTFNHFTRRLHLYLAMLLMPWFFMYGVSSLPFSHGDYFQKTFGKPEWKTRFERTYDIEIPPDADLKQIGAKIMKDNGLEGNFGAFRPNDGHLNLYVFSFLSATQVNYDIAARKLVARDRTFQWSSFLTGMHARGGFEQDSLLSDAWGVTVDIVCLGMLIWVVSGIYMWWKLRQTRLWGWVALGGGLIAFAVFLVKL